MRAYLGIINGKIDSEGSTSLKLICDKVGVSYNSAVRGKRHWSKDNIHTEVLELEIVKIKGRGKK